MLQALITAPALRTLLASGTPQLLCDCTFDLADPAAGARLHAQRHLPGAIHIDLDGDMAAPKQASAGRGRHPLPDPEAFASRLRQLGFADNLPVVAYDSAGGMYAARLWWMLRWLGHGAVQVLDGGLDAWVAAGGVVAAGAPAAALAGALAVAQSATAAGPFTRRPTLVTQVDFAGLLAKLGRPPRLIVDARAPDRFRGENETLDPVGGHIPGAANRFFRHNLGPDGCFKPAGQLRAEWLALLAGRAPADVVAQCGSGVTACHNLLALDAAGLPGAALYPGSWSEWCAQPQAPIATGA